MAMQVRIQLEGLENAQGFHATLMYVYRSLYTAHERKHILNAKCATYSEFALCLNGPAL